MKAPNPLSINKIIQPARKMIKRVHRDLAATTKRNHTYIPVCADIMHDKRKRKGRERGPSKKAKKKQSIQDPPKRKSKKTSQTKRCLGFVIRSTLQNPKLRVCGLAPSVLIYIYPRTMGRGALVPRLGAPDSIQIDRRLPVSAHPRRKRL